MPSPIAHAAAGCAIYYFSRARAPQTNSMKIGPALVLLLISVGFSLLPDIDSVVGVLAGNFGRFHNNATHSLIVGLVMALVCGVVMRWQSQTGFGFWFGVALLSYESHVLMDSATISRGVMALWPFSAERYLFPVTIFYGLHWSDGWLSVRHLWTLITELGFVAVVAYFTRTLATATVPVRSEGCESG